MTRRLALLLLSVLATAGCSQAVTAEAHPTPGATAAPAAATAPAATSANVSCDGPNVTNVSNADELQKALAAAAPGGTIRLAAGNYPGHVTLNAKGTVAAPITLCGPREAVLDGGADDGYTLHLDGADHVRVAGFTVHGGQKGVVMDASSSVTVEGLQITDTGEEALHLRKGSSDNVIRGNVVRNTGSRTEKFGEGIYIGSAKSNWCTYTDCEPDRSDRNVITGNDIAGTTAESVDIKEGTTGGVLRDNTFSGEGMSAADAWVNVKGNAWQIIGNSGSNAPVDGFQTHRILDGWGAQNVFEANHAALDGPGFGINITKDDDGNRVACSNTAEGAAKGLTNVTCS
jgi:hypothetical protein